MREASPVAHSHRESRPLPPLRDIARYAGRFGFGRTVYGGGYAIAHRFVALSIFDCVCLRATHVNHELAETANGLECRFLEPGEARQLSVGIRGPASRVKDEALARGDACFGVIDAGRLANISFYASGPTPVTRDLVVRVDEPGWYMYGAYTPAPYRGRRLHALGVLRAALELFERGVPALFGVYERTNYRSMVSAHRMGWRPCGTLTRVGLGRRTRLRRDAEAERSGMRLERRSVETT
jgi:hypothetical protein